MGFDIKRNILRPLTARSMLASQRLWVQLAGVVLTRGVLNNLAAEGGVVGVVAGGDENQGLSPKHNTPPPHIAGGIRQRTDPRVGRLAR